jgi:hypothetical protein
VVRGVLVTVVCASGVGGVGGAGVRVGAGGVGV